MMAEEVVLFFAWASRASDTAEKQHAHAQCNDSREQEARRKQGVNQGIHDRCLISSSQTGNTSLYLFRC